MSQNYASVFGAPAPSPSQSSSSAKPKPRPRQVKSSPSTEALDFLEKVLGVRDRTVLCDMLAMRRVLAILAGFLAFPRFQR